MAITAPQPSDFPNLFNNPFGRWTKRISKYEEAHPVGIMTSLMAYASAAIGGGPTITTIKGALSTHFWPILCGESGGGGKGDATSAAENIFLRALPGWDTVHKKDGFDTGLGIVGYMDNNRHEDGQVRELLIFEAEVSRIIAQMATDTRMMTTFTKLFDRSSLTYMSGKEQIEIVKPYAVILGHVQPDLFLLTKKSKATAIGVWNRFLFMHVEKFQTLDYFGDIDAKNACAAELSIEVRDRFTWARYAGNVKVPGAVSKRFGTHHRPLVEAMCNQSKEIRQYAQRGLAYLLKIAALYAVWSGREELTIADLDSALDLVAYSVASIKYVLSNEKHFNGRTVLANRVAAFVQQNGPTSWSNMRKHVGGGYDNMAYFNALIELKGEIVLYTLPTNGRVGNPGKYLAEKGKEPPNAIKLDPAAELAKLTGEEYVPGYDQDVSDHPNYRVQPDPDEPVEAEIVEEEPQSPQEPRRALPAPVHPKTSPRPRTARTEPPKTTQTKTETKEDGRKVTHGRPKPTRAARPKVAGGVTDLSALLD